MKWKHEAGKDAFEYHCSGFNCAEAVSKAVVENYGPDMGQSLPRVATAFGGGIGRTHQEICGALSGGIIAIGCMFGRREPGADWTEGAELAAELKRRFVHRYGTTICGALLATFGPQEDGMACKRLSGEVASMLAEMLEKRGMAAPAAAANKSK